MNSKIIRHVVTGISLLIVILVFAAADFAIHGLQDRWAVPDYYFRNKIIFGFVWAVVGFVASRRFKGVLTRALVVAGVVSVTLQARYFIEGFPLDFVIVFLLIHFLILWVLFTGMFRVFKSLDTNQTSTMKKMLIALVVLVAVGVAVYMLVFKDSGSSLYSSPTPTASMSNTPTVTPGAESTTINISNLTFVPSSVTVTIGTRVTWRNNDSVSHTIVSDSGTYLSSSTLAPGQSYSRTFSAAGTYAYHCGIHPTMQGTIVVLP